MIIDSYPWGNYTLELGQIVKHQGEIFDFPYPFYSEAHRTEFERKFLLHFRYHEIGQETLQRFKYMLQDVLTINYEKYNHYFKAWEKAQEMPWWNNKDYYEDIQEVVDRVANEKTKENTGWGNSSTENSTNKSTTQSNSLSTSSSESSSTDINKFLDTPQGKIENLDACYLTNVTQDTSSEKDSSTSDTDSNSTDASESTNTKVKNGNGTKDNNKDVTANRDKKFNLHAYGNIGTMTAGDIVKQWLEKGYINVDKMIMRDCEDLFMQIF